MQYHLLRQLLLVNGMDENRSGGHVRTKIGNFEILSSYAQLVSEKVIRVSERNDFGGVPSNHDLDD